MNITSLRVHVLKTALEQPFMFSQGWVHQRSATLVEIQTDQGITGWGEAFAQGLEPPEIAAATTEHAFKPLVVGANPLDTEVLWHRMYSRARDFGRKGSAISALSGIDIALWDICGKALGQPVWQLLGGAFRREVQPYATGFYRLQDHGEAPRLADEALRHLEAGFSRMKVKLGFGIRDDIACMQAVAQAVQGKTVGGEPVRLMIDTNHAYGRAEALRLGRALEELDLLWYEEPVAPEDLGGYAELRSKLSMPIAGGENEHTGFGFLDLVRAGAVDIAQPDIASCGGFTAMRHIIAICHAAGVQVNPHVWGSAVAQAASLQVLAAIPTTHHRTLPAAPLLEYDRSSHPFRNELTNRPLQMVKGLVAIPDQAGLGIEINREVLERYRA
jgi:D-galactarolactone cycloisomerase